MPTPDTAVGHPPPTAPNSRDGTGVRSAAAERALAEAAERRAKAAAEAAKRPPELPGRAGPDPTRYGDWEHRGLASDF